MSLTLLAALAGFAFSAAPAAAAHPSTVFDANELAHLRATRDDPARAEISAAVRLVMDAQVGKPISNASVFGDVRVAGNALAGYAIAAEIFEEPTWREVARKSLMNALNWSDWGFGEGDDLNRAHILMGAAVAYDVLYPVLSASERTSVRNRIATEAARFASAADNGVWWTTDFVQNHNWINFGALGVAGYALEGEDDRAAGFVSRAYANSQKLKAVFDLVTDGSWHEGLSYQQYGLAHVMPYWMASARRGANFADNAMMRALGAHYLHVQLPANPRGFVTTNGDWTGWPGPAMAQNLRYAAKLFGDRKAQEAARRWAAGGTRSNAAFYAFNYALEFVAHDPKLAPADLTKVPLDRYGDDQQVSVLRSGWGSGSIVLALKNGVLGGRGNYERIKDKGFPGGILNIGHDHVDDLGLWMYGDGEWLLPEVVGYNIGRTSGPKAWMTEFHNSLLIGGRGQLGDERGGTHSATAHSWFFDREAHMPLTASTTGFAFARADGTRLYPASLGPQGITRTVALSRDGYAVLRDTVQMSSAQSVEQVFHFMDKGSQSGAWIRGETKNGRVVGLNVVAPASFSTSFQSVTADKLNKQFEPDGSMTRVRIRPSSNAARTDFLEIVWPGRATTWEQRPQVRALQPSQPHSGAAITFATHTDRWLFAGGGSFEADGFALNGDTALIRTGNDGSLQRVVLLGAGSISDADGSRTLIESTQSGVIEVDYGTDGLARVSGTGTQDARILGDGVTDVRINGENATWRREGVHIVLGQEPHVEPPLPDPEPGSPEDPPVIVNPDDGDGGLPDGAPRDGDFELLPGDPTKPRIVKPSAKASCGCAGPGSPAAMLVLGLLVLGLRRR